MEKFVGDQSFRVGDNKQNWQEMTYGGALSFARRRYSRDLENVDVVISGIPYDCAVTYLVCHSAIIGYSTDHYIHIL